MNQRLRLLLNNAPVKLCSFIIAYALWSSLSAYRERDETLTVPVCFFGCDQETIIKAPETIAITVRGTKRALASLDLQSIAVHVDSTTLTQGAQEKRLHASDLFLPNDVKLIHYEPSNIVIIKNNGTDHQHA